MIRIDDERILFYLKNHKQIEEWAAIRMDVATEANCFLRSMGPEMRNLSQTLGVHLWEEVRSDYPKYFLMKESWMAAFNVPHVGIGLEWVRNDVSFSDKRPPYVGVWVNLDLPGGQELHHQLKEGLKQVSLSMGLRAGPWWPAQRLVPALEEDVIWETLVKYRIRLIREIETLWVSLANRVDEVIQRNTLT